jgi:hypothetical protein
MELLWQWAGPWIALVGWAATTLLILRTARITFIQKHAFAVLAWIVWMFVGFDVLVYNALLQADLALNIYGGLTLVIATFFFFSAWRMRLRANS